VLIAGIVLFRVSILVLATEVVALTPAVDADVIVPPCGCLDECILLDAFIVTPLPRLRGEEDSREGMGLLLRLGNKPI